MFKFAQEVSDELLALLQDKFPTNPVTWDMLAREELGREDRKMKENIDQCLAKYSQGMEQAEGTKEAKEVFSMCFSMLREGLEVAPNCPLKLLASLLQLLRLGRE